jgi:hypothetical protein
MNILMYKLIENTKNIYISLKSYDGIKQFNVITRWSYLHHENYIISTKGCMDIFSLV